jgi:hypothetical protein
MHGDQDWLAVRMLERPRWHVPVLGYRCSEHPGRPAQDRCDRCGQPFCAGPPLQERWHTFWPPLLAALVFAAVLVGGVLAIDRGTAGAVGAGNLIGTTGQVACLQRYPDPGKLYVVGGLAMYGYPPAQLVLTNCHVQPQEAVRVQGSIAGYDVHGQRFSLPLGPVTAEGGANGVLVVTLPVPDPLRFQGSYEIRVTASGHEGSAASAILDAEGNLAQPTAGPWA